MKTCTDCKQEKPLELFNKNSSKKDGKQTLCKVCTRERFKEYYSKNGDKQKAVVRARNIKMIAAAREFMYEYLKSHPCVDCGTNDIRVLEFDHVRGSKRAGVGTLAGRGTSIETLSEEISKCEVRCKNDHAIKTYERMGGTWHDKFINTGL